MAWSQWFRTTSGRITLQWSWVAASFGTYAYQFLPHTLFLEKYQEFVESYERGIGKAVPDRVKDLCTTVLDDLKIKPRERALIGIFTVYGFDILHAGSTSFRSGAIIGIPENFAYENEKDINRKIKVVDKPINWESDAGEQLKESLILSEDARRFAIAREVSASKGPGLYFYAAYPSGAIMGAYMISRTLNERLFLRNHPFRFIMYGLVGTFLATLAVTLTDITTAFLEESSDEEAAGISPRYAEGGVEFYTKLLKRNQAIRALMGEAGEKLYAVSGNCEVFLRMRHAPLTERLRLVQGIVSAKKNESPADDDFAT